MGDWAAASDVAKAMGVTGRGIRKRARREKWRSRWGRGNGGRRMEFLVAALPADVQAALSPPEAGGGEKAPDGAPESAAATGAPPARWLSIEEVPARRRRIAEDRAAALLKWHRRAEKLAVSLADAWDEELGASAATLWRWKRAYDEGGLLSLVPGWRGPRQRIPKKAWKHFLGVYLDPNRPSAELAYEETLLFWAGENGGDISDIPSLATFRRRLTERVPEAALIRYREGPRAFSDKAEPFLTRRFDEIPAGAEWFFDHHQFDFAARSPNGKACRLWVTGCADLRSRKILGWAIVEKPSTDSILAAFAAGVRAFGAPRRVWMDNGKDFRSKEVSGGRRKKRRSRTFGKPRLDERRITPFTKELEIDVHFTRPYSGRSKPIERLFGTLARTFSKRWPSYVGASTSERPESADRLWKKPSALPDLADVCARFSEWVNRYNARPHRGRQMKGLSPDEVFEAERVELRRVSEQRLSVLALRQARPQKVKRNGVSLFAGKVWYWNEGLIEHFGREVVVRYQPSDLSKVWVFDARGRYLAAVERSDLENVSRRDLAAALRRAKKSAALVREFKPDCVPWKYQVAAGEPGPAPAPRKKAAGGESFDVSKLDRELLSNLEGQEWREAACE